MTSTAMQFLSPNSVAPLIEASETYRALERAIIDAQQTVHTAYWTIDPTLTVVSKSVEGSWADLIADTCKRGIEVRIILSDFDPVLGCDYHAAAWASYHWFMKMRGGFETEAKKRLQIICSRHEARVGTAVQVFGQLVIQRQLQSVIDELNALIEDEGVDAGLDRLHNFPGLWPHISLEDEKVSIAHPTLPTVYPGTHHEKLCIVDDSTVFLGGLDINERRYDTLKHEEPMAWHDIACRVQGKAAEFFAKHFRSRWNTELNDFLTFVESARPPAGVKPIVAGRSLEALDSAICVAPHSFGEAQVAPLRTLSRQSKSSFSRTPKEHRTEVLDAYQDAIASADRLIYIETQFIRSNLIVTSLEERAAENQDLELILVLPLLPEEALVEGEPDAATKYGQFLQCEAIERLHASFGPRFGAFTFVRGGPAEPDAIENPRKTEKDIVYVHAKVMIVDSALAIVGSANLNDRSMLTDTETAIAWLEPDAVSQFQVRLWQHALGLDTSDWSPPYVAKWRDHSSSNAAKQPSERTGFVVPLPELVKAAYAEASFLIPPEVV